MFHSIIWTNTSFIGRLETEGKEVVNRKAKDRVKCDSNTFQNVWHHLRPFRWMIFHMFYITAHTQTWIHTHPTGRYMKQRFIKQYLSLCWTNAVIFSSMSFEMLVANDQIDFITQYYVSVCCFYDTSVEIGTIYLFLRINSHIFLFSNKLFHCLLFVLLSSGQCPLLNGSWLLMTQLKAWRCK